jgi:hypothetical protein
MGGRPQQQAKQNQGYATLLAEAVDIAAMAGVYHTNKFFN